MTSSIQDHRLHNPYHLRMAGSIAPPAVGRLLMTGVIGVGAAALSVGVAGAEESDQDSEVSWAPTESVVMPSTDSDFGSDDSSAGGSPSGPAAQPTSESDLLLSLTSIDTGSVDVVAVDTTFAHAIPADTGSVDAIPTDTTFADLVPPDTGSADAIPTDTGGPNAT